LIASTVHQPLLVALALGAAVVVSAAAAKRTRIPPPVFLVLAGLVIAVIPGVQEINLPPDVVFFGFLPPLLYSAAFLTAPREVRENWASILLLAFGLTAATLLAVGLVAWIAVAALGLGTAFVLGSVLGPTDPVSATSVIGATSAPERLRTVLEGESLVNDGVALVAFSIALSAVEHGSFSVGAGVLKFFQLSVGGVVFGIVVAFLFERLRRRIHDAQIEIATSLLTPYVAYIPAERLHLSGILATVACGVYLGWRSGGIFRPEVRLQSLAFWDILSFILNSVLFLLLGTQFRAVLNGLGGYSDWTLVGDALLIFGVVFVVRLLWMFTVPHLVAGLSRRGWSEIEPWQDRFILGWSGMRGALSLAAALSIPASVAHREEILFLTFTTILATLVVLAIPLPWILEWLGFTGSNEEREVRARRRVTEAALRRLGEIEEEGWASSDLVEGLRRLYESRLGRLDARLEASSDDAELHLRLRRELLAAERSELDRLQHSGEIDLTGARVIERQLDLEESGLRS
jgi:CPA1 family monovalent cation:H+ antiporter